LSALEGDLEAPGVGPLEMDERRNHVADPNGWRRTSLPAREIRRGASKDPRATGEVIRARLSEGDSEPGEAIDADLHGAPR
jgi:hypothetical protein